MNQPVFHHQPIRSYWFKITNSLGLTPIHIHVSLSLSQTIYRDIDSFNIFEKIRSEKTL